MISVERGQIRKADGTDGFFETEIEFGDGIDRKKRIPSGTRAWRVMVGRADDLNAEPVTEYWLHHCGNRFLFSTMGHPMNTLT